MIRVLIVDPDPNAVRTINDMFREESDIKVVGEAGHGDEALKAVDRHKPHIVLLDAGVEAATDGQLARALQNSSSHPSLIMTSTENDMDLIRRSMVIGARDHIVKPLSAPELLRAVRAVFAASGTDLRCKARIVGFLGCRGGAGNTTVSLSLAGAAARSGVRVAVIDGNLSLGDVSFLLNTRPEVTWVQWSKDSRKGDLDPRKYLVRSPEGIDILSAPVNPTQAELVSVDSVSKMLNGLRYSHDLIIVDIPGTFNEISLELTEAVQEIYLVSDPTLGGIKNLRLIWDLLEQLRFPHEKRTVLLNRIQKCDKQVVKEAKKSYPEILTLPLEKSLEEGWLRGETPARGMRRSSFNKEVGQLLEIVLPREGVE